ncbi:hypothetical protein ABZ348_05085 [Streptomyces sp. NPDC005963]|uniref:hypothetical protein n=1 Tax=Streptomyces sp. NPDC005963 TaxID=3156721 RepID=UPI0033C647FF
MSFVGSGVAGYGIHRLSLAARRECRVAQEHRLSVLDWWMWEAPLTVLVTAFCGLFGWALAAAVVHRAGPMVRRVVPAVVFVGVLVALALVHFSWLGTPYAMGTVSEGTCGDDNVPPWWPGWLPA